MQTLRTANHMRLLISLSPTHINFINNQPLIFLSNLHFSSSSPRKFLHSSLSIRSSSLSNMEAQSTSHEIAYDYSPFLRIYKDGRVERIKGTEISPPFDPNNKVISKDVCFSPDASVSARVYLPRNTNPGQKLPLLIYFHGGGFCVETAFSPIYHTYVNNQVAEANVMAVSVDYRRVPEHPLPIAYEDSWAALKWIASHSNGDGPEGWINSHADLGRVFLAGDSAGANIAHQIALKLSQEEAPGGIDVLGSILVHPYFWGKDPIGNEPKEVEKRAIIDGVWKFACPTSSGCDDPLINPVLDPKLGSLGCKKVLVIVAEKDVLRDRGWDYYEKLGKSGWGGEVEIMEIKEEDHVFHLENFASESAVAMLKRIASFINEKKSNP